MSRRGHRTLNSSNCEFRCLTHRCSIFARRIAPPAPEGDNYGGGGDDKGTFCERGESPAIVCTGVTLILRYYHNRTYI